MPINDRCANYQFQYILLGDMGAGKSALVDYFVNERFNESTTSTIGIDFRYRSIQINDNTTIQVRVWDTAGKERFSAIAKTYFRRCVAVLLVYDICDRTSWDSVPAWMAEARKSVEPNRPVFALIGCKSDKADDNRVQRRVVTETEARTFAAMHNINCIETSARTGHRVAEAFEIVTKEVYNRIQMGEYCIEDDWHGIRVPDGHPANNNAISVQGDTAHERIGREPAQTYRCWCL